ncbi:sensor histidine kinase [Pedobacter insulae]|uniref:histidine kinase n=1 Tax=Pedobacter insulae TaxID=414048 RepID=A0A1I2WGL8_9SPHI|nr:PAS domain-containing sensor histidine kinase [Pedobacter insulae]SFH00492.1 PAS domain S-box-containing protein [Pedobacter insulae]
MDKKFLDSLTDPVALYENAPCGYLSCTADGKIIKINQTLLNWLELERETVLYKWNLNNLISRGGGIYYEMFYFPLLKLQDSVQEISFDFIRSDGSKFPGLMNSNTVKAENGEILAINSTIFNITDRKKYEHDLLQAKRTADKERNHFEFLSDFVPEMIWTASSAGHINYVNKRFTSFFGNDTELVSLYTKIHQNDRIAFLRIWTSSLRSGTGFTKQIRLRDVLGNYQWYLIQALPNRDDDNQISKWVGTCNNIDEQVSEFNRMDEFISVASHELKTPITTLKTAMQLMERLKSSLDQTSRMPNLIEKASRSVERVGVLIDDLLNTQRIKEGQMELKYSVLDLHQFLEELIVDLPVNRDQQLTLNAPKDILFRADAQRLEQVILNFITNASKYAAKSKFIELKAEASETEIKIAVIDTGEGITAEKLPYLFDRYYRADNYGRQYSGLGLGLYISSEIIKRHGGKIGAESTLGKGSIFWFTLPTITP